MIASDESHPHAEAAPIHLLHICTFIFSIYALCALVVQTLFKLAPELNQLLDEIDFVICLFFLLEFFLNLYTAKVKLHFLKWGWIDFVSSIPVLPVFRLARIVRVIRIIRILRAFRSTKVLVQFVYRRRSHGMLMTAAIIAALLTIFCSIAMLNFETSSNSNIRTPSDALWWAVSTITTVGYGDHYPVTNEGRIVAVFLMTAGVGLFATFTSFITSFFNDADKKKEVHMIQTLVEEIRLLRQKVESLERLSATSNESVLDETSQPSPEERNPGACIPAA